MFSLKRTSNTISNFKTRKFFTSSLCAIGACGMAKYSYNKYTDMKYLTLYELGSHIPIIKINRKYISLDFIHKYKKNFHFENWDKVLETLSSNNMINYDFLDYIVENKTEYPWYRILKYIYPSDIIIDKYGHCFDEFAWITITSKRKLDDEFLDKYKCYVHWPDVLKKREPTFYFINKYRDYFCCNSLLKILDYYKK